MNDLSIVVPVFNGGPLLGEVADRVMSFLDRSDRSGELIFVDDGSDAETWAAIVSASEQDQRIIGIRLDRNYGQHTALMCGLRASAGTWVATIDDDLENPPEEIEKLLEAGKSGSDLVFGRFHRERRPLIRKMGSWFIDAFNRIAFRKPPGVTVSNFRLIHRSVLEAVCRSDLAAPYITGLALLNAHNASNAPVRHERSQLGDSRYSLAQLFALTKIVFTAAFRMRLGAGNENPTEAVHYRIAETIGISAPGPTPREAEPRTAMKEPSNKPTEPSGIAGVYQRIFSLRTYWQLDAVLIAFIALAGFAIGIQLIQQAAKGGDSREAIIVQATHVPAVMIACGHGFADLAASTIPDLDRFLSLEADTFSCQKIPAEIALQPPNQWQRYYSYLMYAIGFVWKVAGISLPVIWAFYGVVFAATLCALYGLMRQVVGPVLALVVLVPIASSNIWSTIFPSLYYFIKAPFFFAAIMLLFMTVLKPPDDRRFGLCALILGALVGLSLGFRRDLMALIPLCVLVLLFCSPGDVLRKLSRAAAGVSIFTIGLVIAGWPILLALSEGSNFGHLALIGLSDQFTQVLGISPSFYDWGVNYFDWDASAVTNAYHHLVLGGRDSVFERTAAYDRASMGYYWNVVVNFPADILLRPIAAAWNAISGFKISHAAGAVLFIAFLGLLAAGSIRAAFLALLIILYASGYPALLYRAQDYFHLLFVPFLVSGFILQRVLESAGRIVPHLRLETADNYDASERNSSASGKTVRAFGFIAINLMAAVSIVALSRVAQDANLVSLFERYWSAPADRIPHALSKSSDGSVTVNLRPLDCRGRDCLQIKTAENGSPRIAYLVAKFDRRRCGRDTVTPQFDYDPGNGHHNYSRTARIAFERSDEAKVFFRSKIDSNSAKRHIVLPSGQAPCLEGVYEIRKETMPSVFLFIVMTDNWNSARRHMILIQERDSGSGPLLP